MLALAVLDLVLAAAGGGSSGFSGGGGGGGFSGGSGSRGGSGESSPLSFLIIVVIVLVVVGVGMLQTWRYRRRRAERAGRVTTASAESAQDDAYFAADAVTAAATVLFRAVQDAWGRDDRAALRTMVGTDLMVEWERRLDDFTAKGWNNVVEVGVDPEVEYLGLVNREDDDEDRVVVRMSCTLVDKVVDRTGRTILRDGASSATVALCEWWTLQRAGDRWMLAAIEQDKEGAHHLDAPIVASPWSDTEALRDEALVEDAAANAALPGVTTGDLVDVDLAADARTQALDLALVDGRFAPDVLEVAVRRAVVAWAGAIDGDDAPLLRIAEPDVVRALLHGQDESGRTRIVVRGGRVERLAVERIDADATPAEMHVAVTVRGRRYVEDRDTAALLAGDKSGETTFTERWTLSLSGPADEPWRLVSTGAAAPA